MNDDSPKPKSTDAAPSNSADDLEALDQFCKDINLDDMEFDHWCATNYCLDLVVPVHLTKDQLPDSGRWEVRFTRTIRWTRDDGTVAERQEKVTITAIIPENCCHGHCLEFDQHGDQFDDQKGKLKLQLFVG